MYFFHKQRAKKCYRQYRAWVILYVGVFFSLAFAHFINGIRAFYHWHSRILSMAFAHFIKCHSHILSIAFAHFINGIRAFYQWHSRILSMTFAHFIKCHSHNLPLAFAHFFIMFYHYAL